MSDVESIGATNANAELDSLMADVDCLVRIAENVCESKRTGGAARYIERVLESQLALKFNRWGTSAEVAEEFLMEAAESSDMHVRILAAEYAPMLVNYGHVDAFCYVAGQLSQDAEQPVINYLSDSYTRMIAALPSHTPIRTLKKLSELSIVKVRKDCV